MAYKNSAREAILDAYQAILVELGEPAATVTAIAERASVSKGGLFYHFASKADLADGVIDRLGELRDADCERIRTREEGAIAYFVHASATIGSPLDQALTAVTRLDQSGKYPRARPALDAVVDSWLVALTEATGDPVIGRILQILGDGLYFNSSLAGSPDAVVSSRVTAIELEDMVQALQDLAEGRAGRGVAPAEEALPTARRLR